MLQWWCAVGGALGARFFCRVGPPLTPVCVCLEALGVPLYPQPMWASVARCGCRVGSGSSGAVARFAGAARFYRPRGFPFTRTGRRVGPPLLRAFWGGGLARAPSWMDLRVRLRTGPKCVNPFSSSVSHFANHGFAPICCVWERQGVLVVEVSLVCIWTFVACVNHFRLGRRSSAYTHT